MRAPGRAAGGRATSRSWPRRSGARSAPASARARRGRCSPPPRSTTLPPVYIVRWYAATARRLTLEITSAVPITGRPSAWPPKIASREEVVDELLRRVLVHRDLLEHDFALLVELGERGREDHVRHHRERGLGVAVGDARIDDRVLARRGRVQLGPHRVERLGDLLRVVGARALEQEVLDEVRDAGAVGPLVAGAGADPEAERDRTDARHLLRDHALARVELREDVLLHEPIVPGCPRGPGAAQAANARPEPLRFAA